MRVASLAKAASGALWLVLFAAGAARADSLIPWGGPGWYAREVSEDRQGYVAGPFDSLDGCVSYLRQHYSGDDLDLTDCVHFVAEHKADQAVDTDGKDTIVPLG
jgi:hypothetical protein